MIIEEENISTETRLNNELFVNTSTDPVTSTPYTSVDSVGTDDSFHSAVGENDIDPLITSLNTIKSKENNKTPRKALGCIKNRHLIETPKADMRRKLWRNMEDERIKQGGENTPPLPFKDLTASAPPKLYRYRKFT